MLEPLQRTIACFWKQFSVGCEPGHRGATCHLPPAFGHWNSQFRRSRRWAKAGVFESLFKAMSVDVDLKYSLIDGTIVQFHQKATGANGGLNIRPLGARAAY